MSGSEWIECRIETDDGAEYTVQTPEISIVATLLVASATLGKALSGGRTVTVGLAGAVALPPDANWRFVRDSSWSLLTQVLETLRMVRAPHGSAAQPNSQTRLSLLKDEAARRVRSHRFEAVAAGSAN